MPNTPVVTIKKLGWSEFLAYEKTIYAFCDNQRCKEIILDFSGTERAYPNGMLPLIASMDRRKRRGLSVKAIPPNSPDLFSVFKSYGWLHSLAPLDWPGVAHEDLSRSLPVQSFLSDSDANEAVSRAVKVCLQQLALGDGVPQALEWVLGELSGNVLVHAGTGGGWLQVVTFKERERLSLVVCDSGVGIPNTMSRKFAIHSDKQAIELALRKGVTSNPAYGQGNGLAGALAIAQQNDGTFGLRSYRGDVEVKHGKVTPIELFPPYHGTMVEMDFSTNRRIDLTKALWGHNPTNIFETEFETERGALVFRLRDYSPSFGTRPTGERIRNLVMNLLKQEGGRTVEIDMTDVGVIASSFADECFGKLFVELGPLDFNRRMQFVNLAPICKALIDRAILERIRQDLHDPDEIRESSPDPPDN